MKGGLTYMTNKFLKYIFILLTFFILINYCIKMPCADILTIYSSINGENIDKEKTFNYKSLNIYQCTGCGRMMTHDEFEWHTNSHNPNTTCEGKGDAIFMGKSLDMKNNETKPIGDPLQTYYCIELLEPYIDDKGNHYQITYQINDGPLQTISTSRSDNEHPTIILNNLPQANSNTKLSIFYRLVNTNNIPPTGIYYSSLLIIFPYLTIGILYYVLLKRKNKHNFKQ